MSFLNALASNGLSVGLRFYNARMNDSARLGGQNVAAFEEPINTAASSEPPCPAKTDKTKSSCPRIQSPEEAASGRAEAQAMLHADGSLGRLVAAPQAEDQSPGSDKKDAKDAENPTRPLNQDEKQQVEKMKHRDREVRTHEQAHAAAGAGLSGAPVYEYQVGPDGKRYAVGGHVDIRTSGSSDPNVALKEAEAVKRAATAPAEPSSTDRAVAAKAAAEISRLKAEKMSGSSDDDEGHPANSGLDNNEVDRPLKGNRGSLNGLPLSLQATGAYAAVKAGLSVSLRPTLARA